jgi:hypothetical protein
MNKFAPPNLEEPHASLRSPPHDQLDCLQHEGSQAQEPSETRTSPSNAVRSTGEGGDRGLSNQGARGSVGGGRDGGGSVRVGCWGCGCAGRAGCDG